MANEEGRNESAEGSGGHRREEYVVSGDRIMAKVRELLREGKVRRLIIRNEHGKNVLEAPLAIGVLGALLLPFWAAVGAVVALVTSCSIIVEREVDEPEGGGDPR